MSKTPKFFHLWRFVFWFSREKKLAVGFNKHRVIFMLLGLNVTYTKRLQYERKGK